MTPATQRLAEAMTADLHAIFAGRLRSLVVYGRHAADAHGATEGAPGDPVHTLAIVSELGQADLDGCARRHGHWRRVGLATPVIVEALEFERSLDAFPLEFGAILSRHEPVYGHDPFGELSVNREDLRRACEVQARSHLLHLREGYIEAANDPVRVSALVRNSALPLRTLLVNLARLQGLQATMAPELASFAGTLVGPRSAVLADVLSSGDDPMLASDGARLFPEYLEVMRLLVGRVDRTGD